MPSLPVTHRLTWWGLDLAGPADDVQLLVPSSCRAGAAAGLRVRRGAVSGPEVRIDDGVRVTSRLRTTIDLARTQPLEAAVVLVDRFAEPAEPEVARASARTMTGRDCRHVRRVLALADGLAGSPQETRLRLLLAGSPLPDPVAQFTVRHRGTFVARVDVGWPEHRLALEYDGLWHAEPGQFAADRARLNRLLAAGWRVVFVTAADLRRPRDRLARIAAALAA